MRQENMEPITVISYLSFAGNCEEAMRSYIDAFGGKILYLSYWNKENSAAFLDKIGKVMHAEFTIGGTRMAAGDSYEFKEIHSPVKLMIHTESRQNAERAIKRLSAGGRVVTPLQPHPAPDDDGCGCIVRDRFGYTWIITCPNSDKAPFSEAADRRDHNA